jgi:putative ABC transport system permease protein
MLLLLNIVEALRAIRANLLRSLLTILIIAFGLTALIGVLTSIDGIRFWFANSFVRLGTNTFRIENYTTSVRDAGRRDRATVHSPIRYQQGQAFKARLGNTATVSVVGFGSVTAQLEYQGLTTQENNLLLGADAEYSVTDNYEIAQGRNFIPSDLHSARDVILLGAEPARVLFEGGNPLDKAVSANGKSYRVIGVFKKIGSQGVVGGDKIAIIPATTLQKDFPDPKRSFSLHVNAPSVEAIEDLSFEAVGALRAVRRLQPTEPNDFGVIRMEAITDRFMENMRFLTYSATAIAIITLFSAAIGLMNNMLVSVTERTREIGVRKALGATRGNLLLQFLTEAVVITQLGGLLGTLFGILIGNLVGVLLGNTFTVPWDWVIGGSLLCFFVGIVAGIVPARKAAGLDPIESLRYE